MPELQPRACPIIYPFQPLDWMAEFFHFPMFSVCCSFLFFFSCFASSPCPCCLEFTLAHSALGNALGDVYRLTQRGNSGGVFSYVPPIGICTLTSSFDEWSTDLPPKLNAIGSLAGKGRHGSTEPELRSAAKRRAHELLRQQVTLSSRFLIDARAGL